MTRIYLIRHAEAEGNLYRIAQGQYNSILTDRGWRQVKAVERRFADMHIDAVYASDLYRTCATASAVYKPKGLPLQRRKALREICVGVWEHKPWGDIAREDPVQMQNFSTRLTEWHVEGAETPQQVQDRMINEVRRIAEENEGRTVAVFSHGYAIRLLLAALQGCTLEEVGQTPHGDNTAVSLLEGTADDLKVVFRDDNSHLRTPEYLQGEKNFKRATALERGLRFEPLELHAQAAFFAETVSAVWQESGDRRAFDREMLLSGTRTAATLVGYLEERPVGLVQMWMDEDGAGRIGLLCVQRADRERGFGIQLIGQAVQYARAEGADTLRILLPQESMAKKTLQEYGFAWKGAAGDRLILEKNIGFDPEYLSE